MQDFVGMSGSTQRQFLFEIALLFSSPEVYCQQHQRQLLM